ncbi:hypothetical protein RUM43_003136 [Polyplax serrata]|uniref:Uncharacterized protein n=1 Tax=Polyplax serrata TaxID=468196 RepID=A0AAN8S6D5_POLSC
MQSKFQIKIFVVTKKVVSVISRPFSFAGVGERMDGLRALDVMTLLQERLAILTGGRDRRGGPVLLFPATPRRERAKPDDYRRLLQYLLAIPW